MKNAVTEWTRLDSAAAGDWLNTLPRTALRDQAVSVYCEVLATRGLEAVSEWAATINDTALREQSLRRIAEEWMGRNPQTTVAWLPNSGLSTAAVEKLTQDASQALPD